MNGNGQEPNEQGQESTEESTQDVEETTSTDAGAEPKTFDEDYVKELRSEAAKYRKQLRELEKGKAAADKRLQEIEDQELSDKERLKKQLAESQESVERLQRENRESRLRAEVERLARSAGFAEAAVGDVYRLLDLSNVEEGDDGFAGLDKMVKQLLKDKPYMVKSNGKTPEIDASKAGTASQEPDTESLAKRFGI